jgi:hypothetical protein
MTTLSRRRHCCACGLSYRSSFHIGGLRSRSSRGSGCGLLALCRRSGLGLRRIWQRVVLLLAGRIRLLRRARQKRHFARYQKCPCHQANREAF